MALNHTRITNAKPRAKAYKITDSGGLYLAVQPAGSKLWRFNYRFLGRQSRRNSGISRAGNLICVSGANGVPVGALSRFQALAGTDG